MSPEAVLAPLLAQQAGVVTLGQAVAAGVSASSVHRRVRSGAWELLRPGVYLVGGHRARPRRGRRRADRTPSPAPAARSGHVVVRRDLSPVDRVEDRHLVLTAQPLTALETALVLPEGSSFLDRALQRHVRFPTLYRAYCRNLGRRESGAAGRMISAAADRADPAAERLLVKLLRDAGITGWVLGHPFGPWRIDLAFPAAMLGIEVDGWAWHVDVERFRNDRRTGNALHRGGWNLLRYTWHDLDGSPVDCVQEIAESLPAAA